MAKTAISQHHHQQMKTEAESPDAKTDTHKKQYLMPSASHHHLHDAKKRKLTPTDLRPVQQWGREKDAPPDEGMGHSSTPAPYDQEQTAGEQKTKAHCVSCCSVSRSGRPSTELSSTVWESRLDPKRIRVNTVRVQNQLTDWYSFPNFSICIGMPRKVGC